MKIELTENIKKFIKGYDEATKEAVKSIANAADKINQHSGVIDKCNRQIKQHHEQLQRNPENICSICIEELKARIKVSKRVIERQSNIYVEFMKSCHILAGMLKARLTISDLSDINVIPVVFNIEALNL